MRIGTVGIGAALVATVVAVVGCYLVGLERAAAQGAAGQQYAQDGQGAPEGTPEGTPAPEQRPAEKVTLCHATGSETNPYVTITVSTDSTRYQGHQGHPGDIIPAPPGGCPSVPEPTTPNPEPTAPEPTAPEPTVPEPTSTASASVTPEPTAPEPTSTATASATTEPTDGGGCPVPEPTTPSASASSSASATATATAEPTGGVTTPEPTTTEPTTEPTTGEPTTGSPGSSASASAPVTVVPTAPASPAPTAGATEEPDPDEPFVSTPTAIATNPGENPDGPFEVTGPDGEESALSFFDLDVHDDPPLPGGPGGITRSEMRGQRAAAQALAEGGDFHEAVAAAQPFLNACDSRDAVRLAAVQLGEPLPETGGPRALAIFAAATLLGSGLLAWRLVGVRGRP